MQKETVQGLWIGKTLSTLERLSIRSFLALDHRYDLYTYDDIDNVPEGANLKDAGQIVSADRIFRYTKNGSFAGFSNFFRYRLLFERGNWWADMDVVCIKQLSFAQECVVSSERVQGGWRHPNTGILKFPCGSAAMDLASRICDLKETSSLAFGETGPALMEWLVSKFALDDFVQKPEVFCPIPYHRFREYVEPEGKLSVDAVTAHLWNEMWRSRGLDKDVAYPSTCLYEQLKARYLEKL